MRSTMQDAPLLIRDIVRHGQWMYADKRVFTATPSGMLSATFADVAQRAEKLASALARLGVQRDDRVATLMWNNQTHMEVYLAVPSMGAILHTLNVRLFPEQLAFIINHASDKVIIVDPNLVPLLAGIKEHIPGVEHIIVNGPAGDVPFEVIDYEEFITAEGPGFDWPDLDEKDAAVMCYTSGTTGDPKGVVYSHRSTWLHSMASTSANSIALSDRDRCLLVVPMFHVNAWGAVYTAFMAGTELIMPQMFLQGEPLLNMIMDLRPTLALGVPTIWNDLLRAAGGRSDADLTSLRIILAGGAAVPRFMIEAFRERHGVDVLQGWGMTETSPLVAVSTPPMGVSREHEIDYRVKAGRVMAGVEVRLTNDEGEVLARDGVAVGEFELRGPWITAGYFGAEAPELFRDGWLRTGDIGTLDPHGYMVITDRAKDMIKSGGEWISSVELETTVQGHEGVFEAAVVAIPDDRWQERPLCVVVRTPESDVSAHELREYLSTFVAKWWLPEHWSFVESLPKTSVGKFDKRALRRLFAEGQLQVETL
ncbi:MAG: long-chain fatty acid--CoA ligase [Acidimicrobiaceae bacterium]|nr:long-chain fatty acid--CoA ligase [Acidimicrobiaceae bacterium]